MCAFIRSNSVALSTYSFGIWADIIKSKRKNARKREASFRALSSHHITDGFENEIYFYANGTGPNEA